MSTAVAKVNAQLPAAIRNLLQTQGQEIMQEVTGGVTSGFPVISIRGKVWRIRKSGVDEDVVNEEGDPIPSIDVVLIKSNPQPSKIFYAKDYEEGATDTPDCWSADGIKPDVAVQKPVCKTCAACPNNVWGSKITKTGSKTKACSDARRMAIISMADLEAHGGDATLHLLRVPPASLNPLKDYAEKALRPMGIPYFAVVTRITFDKEASYPKMAFKAKRYLSEDEAAHVLKLRDSEDARRILAESEEYGGAGTTEGSEAADDSAEATPTAPAASAPKKKPAAPKPRPAEEEDVGLDEAPAPAPVPAAKPKKAAAPPPVVEEEEEIEAPAPAPKKAAAPAAPAAKKKPAPAPVAEEVEEEIEAPAAPLAAKKKAAAAPAVAGAGDDFDSMLDSILNG